VEIKSVGCLWACSHGCVVSVASPDKPTYLFVNLTPEESATALLDFMQLYIKSPKGTVVWKQIPELLQSAIFAQIPPVLSRWAKETLKPKKL
jgi:predicted metal-binding protein